MCGCTLFCCSAIQKEILTGKLQCILVVFSHYNCYLCRRMNTLYYRNLAQAQTLVMSLHLMHTYTIKQNKTKQTSSILKYKSYLVALILFWEGAGQEAACIQYTEKMHFAWYFLDIAEMDHWKTAGNDSWHSDLRDTDFHFSF